MILLADVMGYYPDDVPLNVHSETFKDALGRAIAEAVRDLEARGSWADTVVTYRGYVLAVVRQDVNGQTDVARFDLIARM